MNVYLPDHLYKYLPLNIEFDEIIEENGGVKRSKNGFDALQDILVNNKIYYSKPRYFNDPFEFDAVILKFSQNDKDQKLANNLLHRCSFISFSKKNNKILMWSHYADAHRGICLRFKCIEDDFYSQNGSGRIVEVTYDDKIITKEKSILSDTSSVFDKMSRKARCWKYEDEFRIFKIPSTRKADDAYGNHYFNSKLVDAVYFGLKTEDEDKQKIIKIIVSAKHKINIYQAVKNKTHLKIDFVKIKTA